MNRLESPVPDEIEIGLSSFLWSLLAAWRKVLVFGLLFALLLGGFKGYSGFRKARDPQLAANAQAEYALALENYQEQKTKLTDTFNNITEEIAEMEYYQQNSALFSIDPNRAFVEEVVYFIAAEPDVSPEGELVASTSGPSLVSTYSLILSRIDAEALLSERTGKTYSSEYGYIYNKLNTVDSASLLIISADRASGLVMITAVGADADAAHYLIKKAQEEMFEKKAVLDETIHAHTLTLLSSKSMEIISSDLIKLHTTHEARVTAALKNLDKAKSDLSALQAPVLKVYSLSQAVKDAAKNAVIGFLLGMLLALICLSFRLLSKAKALSANDLSKRYRLPVLGVICGKNSRCRIDRYIACKRGVACGSGNEELAVENLRLAAGDAQRVLLVGTADRAAIDALCGALAPKLAPLHVCAGGDVCTDAESVRELGNCDAVVFAERIGVSSYHAIDREILKVLSTGRPVLGFILV